MTTDFSIVLKQIKKGGPDTDHLLRIYREELIEHLCREYDSGLAELLESCKIITLPIIQETVL